MYGGVASYSYYPYLTNIEPQLQGGANLEVYPNGHAQNMIRFMFSMGFVGSFSRYSQPYNYSPNFQQVTLFGIGVLGGVGLAYFGKKGFHFKVYNSVGPVYHSFVMMNNTQFGQYTELNAMFKPTIRFGYRF